MRHRLSALCSRELLRSVITTCATCSLRPMCPDLVFLVFWHRSICKPPCVQLVSPFFAIRQVFARQTKARKTTKEASFFFLTSEPLKFLGKGGKAEKAREAKKQGKEDEGRPSSVRFGYCLGIERFEQFPLSVPAVPL